MVTNCLMYKPTCEDTIKRIFKETHNKEGIRQYNLLTEEYIGMHFLKINHLYIINTDLEIDALTNGLESQYVYINEYESYSVFKYYQMCLLDKKAKNFIHIYKYEKGLNKLVLVRDELVTQIKPQPLASY